MSVLASAGRSFATVENHRSTSGPFEPQPLLTYNSNAAGAVLVPDPIRLSLCVIVRDNESTIRAALESIKPWVDEIIVVDTGSVDRTPDICRELGARVYTFPWCDDFSAARNESLKYARGEWIFWMDSDDTLPPHCGQGMRTLIDGPHDPTVLGYIMQVHCPAADNEGIPDLTVVDHVKLFRNRPDVRFEGRIHEQLLPSIRRATVNGNAGGDVAWTDLYVVHSGSDPSLETHARKIARDLRILFLELNEKPEHPFVLFNLGMTYADDGQYVAAVKYLEQSIARSEPGDSQLRKAYALLVHALMECRRAEDAQQACFRGLHLYPNDTELLFRWAKVHNHFGRLRDAEQAYFQILNMHSDRHFTSIDVGLAGYKTRQNLAVLYSEMGRSTDAADQWQKILDEHPGYRPAWRGLAEVFQEAGDFLRVDQIANHLESTPGLACEAWLIRGRVALAQNDIPGARFAFETALAHDENDYSALSAMCQLLFEHVGIRQAEPYVQRMYAQTPDDPSTLANLGIVHQSFQRFDEAITAFELSLQLRPLSIDTRIRLAGALQAIGDFDRADSVLQEGIRICPNEPQLCQARGELLNPVDEPGELACL